MRTLALITIDVRARPGERERERSPKNQGPGERKRERERARERDRHRFIHPYPYIPVYTCLESKSQGQTRLDNRSPKPEAQSLDSASLLKVPKPLSRKSLKA